MLDHCTYDKIKLLHELSKLTWFVEKHGKRDAQAAGDSACFDMFEELAIDLQKHVEKLEKTLCK